MNRHIPVTKSLRHFELWKGNLHVELSRVTIKKGVSINKAGLGPVIIGGSRMMKKRLAGLAMLAAVTVFAAGCGQTRVTDTNVVKESEKETQAQAQTQAQTQTVETQARETEKESETQKLITSVEYTSKDGTVKITLPDNTWKVTQDADEMRVFSSASDAMINIVHASTESAMKTLSIQKTEDELNTALTKQYSDTNAYEVQSFEAKTIGNVNTYRYVVKYNAAARMWAYSVTYGIVAQGQAYVITGTVTEDNSTLLKAVEDSVDSFTVLKDEELMNITSASTTTGTAGAAGTGETNAPASAAATAATSSAESASLTTYASQTTMYSSDIVNVRSGPGTDTEVISGFNIGDAVTVTGETNGWYQVNINGTTGYVKKDFLSTTKTETPQTTAQSNTVAAGEAAAGTNYGSAVTMYATDGVNVRSGPSTDSNVSGTVGAGTALTVVGETDNWYIVSTGSGTGYVSKAYVSSTAVAAATTTTDTTGSAGTSSGNNTASGYLGGVVTSYSGDSIILAGDDGRTYTVYTGGADISSSSGLESGDYVSLGYTQNSDGSLNATVVNE